jgi:putative flippase GtrA
MTKMTMTKVRKIETTTAPDCEGDVPPTTLVRWYKFNLVGGMGIAVQFAALLLVRSVLHFNYLAATAIAVEAAVVHNFIWHEHFTWADRTKLDRTKLNRRKLDRSGSGRRSWSRLLRFNLTTGAISIFGSVALMRVMVGLGHTNYLLTNAIAISLCSLANFLVSESWVFETSARAHGRRRSPIPGQPQYVPAGTPCPACKTDAP